MERERARASFPALLTSLMRDGALTYLKSRTHKLTHESSSERRPATPAAADLHGVPTTCLASQVLPSAAHAQQASVPVTATVWLASHGLPSELWSEMHNTGGGGGGSTRSKPPAGCVGPEGFDLVMAFVQVRVSVGSFVSWAPPEH